MIKLIKMIVVLAITISVNKLFAQTKTTNIKENTVAVSYSSNSGEKNSSSSAVSVRSTNTTYKFNANFDSSVTPKVEKVLIEKLSKVNQPLKKSGKTNWNLVVNKEKVLECNLDEGYLRIFMNKEIASKKFQNTIEALVEELREIISSKN